MATIQERLRAFSCADIGFVDRQMTEAADALDALVEGMERIAALVAASPSSSDHARLHAALDTLNDARGIARAALARVKQ